MTHEREIQLALRDEFCEAIEYRRPPWGGGTGGRGQQGWRRGNSPPIGKSLARLVSEAQAGQGLAVLVPARTETRWFRECVPWEVRFLRGRVRFEGWNGAAPFPSALVVMGPPARRWTVWGWDVRGYSQMGLLEGERLTKWGNSQIRDGRAS